MSPNCGWRRSARPADISALLSELVTAGAELRSQALPDRGVDAELDGELDRYRQNIEQLRELLPSIQGQLLAERARIESHRARIESAAQWAKTSRQTL
jgi:hypothetical protein